MKNFNKNSIITIVISLSYVFGFALPAIAAGPVAINLGSAGNFVILAKTGISTTGTTSISGDIGLSPAAASYITGFSLTLPASSAFSTSVLVGGKVYAPGYANPASTIMTTSVLDMQNAYTSGAGRTNPTATELGAGNIGGITFAPGLYKWSTGVTIPSDITLSGGAHDVWIFQIAQNLTVSSGVKVTLSGGAQANNIFWVVAGQTTIGTTAQFVGNILDQTAIVFKTGATLNGRALAQTAVTLDSNQVYVSPVSANPAANSNTNSSSNVASTYNSAGVSTGYPTPANTNQNSNAPVNTASAFGQQIKSIATNLLGGSRDTNVIILQRFLISENKGSAARALANVGATAYFGTLTRAALAEFQAKVGISPAYGNFGPITRIYLSAHY